MLFHISDLTKKFSDRTVLDVSALALRKGEIHGLQGPNGAGKTTLLNILALLEAPTAGTVAYKSEPVRYSETYLQRLRKEVVLVDQLPLLFTTTVYKNMEFGLKIRGIEKQERKRRIMKGLDMVGMGNFTRAQAQQLSGGETQRVALASRLVLKPEVLLLDEPTANVDVASAQQIKEAALLARREWNTTLIIASHDRDWLYDVCDQVMHLFKGRIFGTGKENVIFGPWREPEPGKWVKVLSDKQQLVVPGPPDQEAAAVIDMLSVSEDELRTSDNDIVLRGTVSRLNLEKNTGQVIATIRIGNLSFAVELTLQQKQKRIIFPGKNIFIHYSLDRIKWI
jgi:tungstate transport system ATP-binding protein